MNQKEKAKYIGLAGALLVHVALIVLLFVVGFSLPEKQEEGGVPVLMGEVPEAAPSMDPSLVEVDVLPDEGMTEPEIAPVPEALEEPVVESLLTQNLEESVEIPAKKEEPKKEVKPVKKPEPKKKTEPKKEDKPKKEVKPKPVKPEKTEAQKAEEARKAAEAEAARKAAEAERARKAAEEAARKRVAGAFGKGAKMTDKGNSKGSGVQGNPAGNSSTGKVNGSGGYGDWDLGGRSIGQGGLPMPIYNEQDEGRVVVDITVNPAGVVVATAINRKTNTVNPVLRKAAEDAAKKARFNAVSGLDNQQGTITYYFKFK